MVKMTRTNEPPAEEGNSTECMGDSTFASHLTSGLNHLRLEGAFCDVTIIVNNQPFPAHKAVLSASSTFFMKAFASRTGLQNNDDGSCTSEVVVDGNPENFAQLLDYAYLGLLQLSQSTVCETLRMANQVGFTEAAQLCVKYITQKEQQFTLEEVFRILELIEKLEGMVELKELFSLRLLRNFISFSETKCFLQHATKEFLMNCLCSEEIEYEATNDEDGTDDVFEETERANHSKEEEILQAVVRWLNYNWHERHCHAADILSKVRLGLIPVKQMMRILGQQIFNIPDCKSLVEEVFLLQTTEATAKVPLTESHPEMFATRNTITATLWSDLESTYQGSGEKFNDTAFLYCERHRDPDKPTRCYKLTKFARFQNFNDTDSIYSSNGQRMLVTSRGTLYVAGGINVVHAGGFNLCVPKKDFFVYQAEYNEWIRLPSMIHDHFHPAMVELDKYIYAIGGMRLDSILSTDAERFNQETCKWEEVAPMIRRDWFYLWATVYNGYILATGSSINTAKTHTQMYNPDTNTWTMVLETTSAPGETDLHPQFIVHNHACYYVCMRRSTNGSERRVVVRNASFDLESDRPSITLGDEVDLNLESEDIVLDKYAVKYTFDKRKLGSTFAYDLNS